MNQISPVTALLHQINSLGIHENGNTGVNRVLGSLNGSMSEGVTGQDLGDFITQFKNSVNQLPSQAKERALISFYSRLLKIFRSAEAYVGEEMKELINQSETEV